MEQMIKMSPEGTSPQSVVKPLASNAEGVGLIPSQGAKIPKFHRPREQKNKT